MDGEEYRVFAVDESLYPAIKGQADTEVLFYLALSFGLARGKLRSGRQGR